MNIFDVRLNARMCWTDPEGNIQRGTVAYIQGDRRAARFDDDVVSLALDAGGIIECFAAELSLEAVKENIA